MEFFASLAAFDHQSAILIIFSVLLTFVLSGLIVFTYEKASRDVVSPDHFLQSLVLMSLVTTTIMQSIGDSLARGFGIFGALAILRFRTQLFSPRNISFIFAAMAVGIACGVYSFANAIIGTLAFCAAAFFLRLTPFSRKNNLRGQLRFDLPVGVGGQDAAERILGVFSKRYVLKRYRLPTQTGQQDFVEYTYDLRLRDASQGVDLTQQLKQIDGVQNIRINFEDTYY
jgi:uncharacterized membrane protein YhiD involved in acid resistance